MSSTTGTGRSTRWSTASWRRYLRLHRGRAGAATPLVAELRRKLADGRQAGGRDGPDARARPTSRSSRRRPAIVSVKPIVPRPTTLPGARRPNSSMSASASSTGASSAICPTSTCSTAPRFSWRDDHGDAEATPACSRRRHGRARGLLRLEAVPPGHRRPAEDRADPRRRPPRRRPRSSLS